MRLTAKQGVEFLMFPELSLLQSIIGRSLHRVSGRSARLPASVTDAAYAILVSRKRSISRGLLIDEELLRE